MPRKNELLRQTEFSIKLVAANIDTIVIVCAVEPEPSLDLIDHYLVAAENLPASAIVVINKMDLINSNAILNLLKNKYENLPYSIIETSIKNPSCLDLLSEKLSKNTCVFVGQSGVGKSTLINALIPSTKIKTQSISTATLQGKHTTSVTILYDLPHGGELIDSPGVRDFLLPKLNKEKIIHGFYEIRELGRQCKFHNCAHMSEPNCAVKDALNKGKLNQARYTSYKNMMQSYG